MMMAACVAPQRVISLPGVKIELKVMLGLTLVRDGPTVRFLRRLRAINDGLVVLPSTGQPSKLPGPCPNEVGGTNNVAANKVVAMLHFSKCLYSMTPSSS